MFSILSGAAVDPDFPQEIKERALQGINKKQQWQVREEKENNNKSTKHVPPFNFKQTAAVASERKKKTTTN